MEKTFKDKAALLAVLGFRLIVVYPRTAATGACMITSGTIAGLAHGAIGAGCLAGTMTVPMTKAITTVFKPLQKPDWMLVTMAAAAISVGAITGYATQPDRPAEQAHATPAELTK